MDPLNRIHNALTEAEEAISMAQSQLSKLEVADSHTSATEAINQIRRGDYSEAITTLEREFLPKWKDKAACDAAYRMFNANAPIDPVRTGFELGLAAQIEAHAGAAR